MIKLFGMSSLLIQIKIIMWNKIFFEKKNVRPAPPTDTNLRVLRTDRCTPRTTNAHTLTIA